MATIAPPAAKPKQQRVLPAKTPPTRVGLDGLSDRTREVLAAARLFGSTWSSASEIAAACDMTPNTVRRHLQRLVERGLLEARGETVARRYRAAEQDNGSSGGGERLAIAAPTPPSSEEAKPDQLLSPRGQTKSVAKDHGLTRQGLKIVRARVLDHCSRRRLDEQSLATMLNVSREVVADICGELLLDDKIVLHPDGRYEVPA